MYNKPFLKSLKPQFHLLRQIAEQELISYHEHTLYLVAAAYLELIEIAIELLKPLK